LNITTNFSISFVFFAEEIYLNLTDKWKSQSIPGLTPPNLVQSEAINKSLRQPFTLIQGPPGTGKTVMGVQLVYLYVQINRSLPQTYDRNKIRPQVLCCGPSNKSVDIIASKSLHS